jgi:acetyl esterase/lipase
MKLEHIIFAGDSAGGHLTVSVALLVILRGFRKPDAIFSHYPCFSTEVRFFPSVLLTMDEWLLSDAFMSCVMSCF